MIINSVRPAGTRRVVTCACVGLLITAAIEADVRTYDVKSDFSTTQNPNEAWSYNIGGVPISARLTGAYGSGWGYDPSWPGSIVQAPEGIAGQHDMRPGDIVMHSINAGGGPDNSVRLTIPRSGTLDLAGRTWDANSLAGRELTWRLTLNGSALAGRDALYGTYRGDAVAQFENNIFPGQRLTGIPVVAGDIVEYTPHTPSGYGFFAGLELTATLTTEPCPADINDDGVIDVTDYLEFLNLFGADDPRVDFSQDGRLDFADYLEFFGFYDAGC